LVFDFVSFAAGVVSGALVGALAGYLHETETLGELQEQVRSAVLQVERIASRTREEAGEEPARTELRRQLLELQEEIKKLYRKQDR